MTSNGLTLHVPRKVVYALVFLALGAVLLAQQPVTVVNTPAVTVTGTVTANAGTNLNTSALALDATLSSLNGKVTAVNTGAVTVSAVPANQTINVTQFGGTNVSTGTGAGGAGIPRYTMSNDSSLAANQSINVSQINGVTPLMGSGNTGTGSPRQTISTDQLALPAWGLGATGAAVPAGSHYVGGNAATALPTAASAGNLTGAMFDKYGRQVVALGTVRDLVGTQTTTLSATTSETTIVTAAASVFNDLVMLIISNTSAATNTRIDFRDTTGGSVLFSVYSVAASPPTGFALPVPIPQTTVNTAWTAQCATSTTDIRIYAVFQKNR